VINAKQVQEKLSAQLSQWKLQPGDIQALVIRTTPNQGRFENFSGTNPPYLTIDTSKYLVEQNIQHLLVDLPSVDREDDQGLVGAHSVFFGMPFRALSAENQSIARSATEARPERSQATITELCFIPEEVQDGLYVLNLQCAPLLLDAIPSRAVLFGVDPS
jgi:arylformamidase